MKPKLTVGMCWGRVRVDSKTVRDREFKTPNGLVEVWRNRNLFILKCECGGIVEVWESDFAGKKYYLDCGCGIALNDIQKVSVMVRMPSVIDAEIRKLANKTQKGNYTQTIIRIIKEGLRVLSGK